MKKIFKHIHFQFSKSGDNVFIAYSLLIFGFFMILISGVTPYSIILISFSLILFIYLRINLIKSYSLYKYFLEINNRNINFCNTDEKYILKGNAYLWWGNTADNPARHSILGTHIIYYSPFLKHYYDFVKWERFYNENCIYSSSKNLDFLKIFWDEKKDRYKVKQEIVSNKKYELFEYLPLNRTCIENINRSWNSKLINFFKHWFFIKEGIAVLKEQDSNEITLLYDSEFRVLFQLA